VALVVVGALLAAGGIVGLGLAGDRGPAPGGGDLEVDLSSEEVVAVANGPGASTGPVCLPDPDCVAWIAPASIAGRAPTATVVDDLALVRVRDGLEARDVATGHLRWRTALADAAERRTYLPVATTGDLALLTDVRGGEVQLLAIELADGTVRWRLPDVEELVAAHAVDEQLLVQVIRPQGTLPVPADASRSATARPEQVLAVSPDDGEVRWEVGGSLLRVVRDGVVVVEGDEVRVVDPDGRTRWRADALTETRPGWLHVAGRFVRVVDVLGRSGPARSLADGREVPYEGDLVAIADLEAADGDPYGSDAAAIVERHPDGTTDLSLLDGDEVAWERTFERIGCCAPPQLEGDRLTVPAADGGRWVLDRRDGSLIERTPPSGELATSRSSLPARGDVTVEEIGPASARSSELALVERGRTTVRLPANTWPVGVTDEVIVLRGDGWVAAIHRDRTIPGDGASGNGASGDDGAIRGDGASEPE
jgi:hypothetical protein